MPISKRIVFVNSISSFLSLLVNLFVLVWLQQYLLKRISAEEYALLPVIMSIISFIPLFSIILTAGIGRYITIAYAKGDDEEVVRIVSTMFPILSIFGLILLIIGWFGAWHIGTLIPVSPERLWEARLMLGMMIFVAAVQLPAAAFDSGFVVTQRLILRDIVILACQLLNNILLFILLFGVSTKVIWVVTALSISQIIQMFVVIPISLRLYPVQKVRLKSIHWPLATEISAFGGWNFVSKIVRVVKDSLDPLILVKYATVVDVATFHVGGMAYRQVNRILTPLLMPIFPVLSALEATNDISKMRRIAFRYGRYSLWLSLLAATPLMAFSKELIYLYIGDKYIEASNVIILLLLAMIFPLVTILCPAVAIARGMIKGLALRESVSMVLNILLTIVFVVLMQMGATGSALATLLSSLIIYPLLIIPYNLSLVEGTVEEFFKQVIWPGMVPAFVTFISLIIVKYYFSLDSWFTLILWSAFGGVIYCIVLFAGCLQDQDSDEIVKLFRYIKKKIKGGNK